ncbi:hypothetical protein FQR65_LT10819 [Abscondita terminalis]|nr:hypothetical protein FQR65_LT10819 [Abscondita terminalis]
MHDQDVKVSKRSGTEDLGKLYELKAAALFALRCVENRKIESAWFASNVNNADDLDDVIVHVIDDNNVRTMYLMQLKHQDQPKKLRRKEFLYDAKTKRKSKMNEDFSVFKYETSYSNIKRSVEVNDGVVKSWREADEVYYVLYTNRPLGADIEFVDVCEEDFELLDTSVGEGNVYNFKTKKLPIQDSTFVRSLKLFTKQTHAAAIDELIKKELRRIACAVRISNLEVNTILRRYLNFFETSIRGVKGFDFGVVTKHDIEAQLAIFFLKDHLVRFSLNCPSRPEFAFWNEIVKSSEELVVVEATNDSTKFLKSYVSAKVAEYYYLDNWNQELCKASFEELRDVLLKTVGDGGLTPQSVYEALWLMKKVPLLVEVETAKEFKQVQAAVRLLRISKPNVVVLTNVSVVGVLDLNRLDEEHRNVILNHPIRLQGRSGARLGDVVDKSMRRLIKGKDIIEIISNRYRVGKDLERVCQHYVPRALSKVLFKPSVLKKIDSKHHELTTRSDNLFELKRISGSTSNFRKYQIIQPPHLLCHDLSDAWTPSEELYDESACVINANPGMGKTELLNHVALHAPTMFWVLKINLIDHQDYYKTFEDDSNHLKYFFDRCDAVDELTEKVFWKLVKRKMVLVLFDGFDEVSMTYKDEASSIAKSFREMGLKVWVSTRPITSAHLEEALDTIARTLKPFDFDEQKKFLIDYFGETRTEFVDKLLTAVGDNLDDFAGLPLHTKLLANVFEKNSTIPERFDLVFLYEHFLDEKMNIFCEKFGDVYRELRKFLEKVRELFALRVVFPKRMLKKLRVKEKLEEYYEDDDQMVHFMQREGVVVIRRRRSGFEDETFKVSFVHRTFAEFVAARWLYKNYKKGGGDAVRDLIRTRFDGWNEFLFEVFDRYVAEGCPLHLGVINRRKEEVLGLLKSDASRVDGGGRTIAHLVACYGLQHLSYMYEEVGRDEMAEIIDEVHHCLDSKDDILGYDALEYAIGYNTLAVADKLCQKLSSPPISLDPYDRDSIFYYCDTCRYRYLFLSALKYFVRGDLLEKRIKQDVRVARYCDSLPNLMQYARDYNFETVFDVVKIDGDDVELVAAFGNERKLADLLERADGDKNAKKALRYATLHNRLENAKLAASKLNITEVDDYYVESIEMISVLKPTCEKALIKTLKDRNFDVARALLDRGVDVNTTSLLHACKLCKFDIVEKIVSKIEDINECNKNGESALLVTVSSKSRSYADKLLIVQLLVKNGIDVNLQDEHGDTALHEICGTESRSNDAKDFNETAASLLIRHPGINWNLSNDRGYTALDVALNNEHVTGWKIFEDISDRGPIGFAARFGTVTNFTNARDRHGRTELYYAVLHQRNTNAIELISHQVDVNLRDCHGDTALHVAADAEITSLLISAGADLNHQNRRGETPLHAAIERRNVDAALVLVDKGADVNLTDVSGTNAFHLSCKYLDVDFLKRILPIVSNINAQNLRQQSALHLLTDVNVENDAMLRLLIRNGVDVNLQDEFGYTALHLMCELENDLLASTLFVEDGVRLDLKNDHGDTPFDVVLANPAFTWNPLDFHRSDDVGFVARFGSETDLSRLVVDANEKDLDRALFHALAHNRRENARLLISKGADLKSIETKLHLFSKETISLLTTAGVNLNARSKKGRTSLLKAFKGRKFEAARALVDEGADVDVVDASGRSPLMYACKYGEIELVRKILPKTADVNVRNDKGETALHTLVERAFDEIKLKILRLLIEAGIDASVRNECEETAYESLSRNKNNNDECYTTALLLLR